MRSMDRYDVLVVGGGFGGAMGAKRLERLMQGRGSRVLLVAPENFMLFSPLLPEAASGTLEPRHAVVPLRELLRRTEIVIGEVTSLDPAARTATISAEGAGERTVSFRCVLLAPGSIPTVFPIPGLLDEAVGFKTLADAIWLRNQLLHQIDVADAATDAAQRRRHLTFTFVGGGYAGVEALAEMESLARDAVRFYPGIAISDFRWVLVEPQPTLLPGLDERLARFSLDVLRRRRIEVHLETKLESCVDKLVVLSGGGEPYHSETIVWTAGQRPHPVAAHWGLPTDDRGRIPVDDHLRVDGFEDVFAVGDIAAVPDPDGGTTPATAQHAQRHAHVAAHNIAAFLGVGRPEPFTYRNRGLAVTLGKWQGTAQVKRFTFTGPLAWWMGRSYHLYMMPGFARKFRVVADWTMALLFPRNVAQLGSLGTPSELK